MDKWMVAVAAGAGYIAQHFKKCKQTGGQTIFTVNPDSSKQPSDKKPPFRPFSKKESLKHDDSESKNDVCQVENGIISGNYEGKDGNLVDVERGALVIRPSARRSRISLRSRRTIGRTVRPLSSLESCLMAQLYTENIEKQPSIQTVRPFFVTDGSNVINRASGGAFIVQNNTVERGMQTYSKELSDATLLVCIGMSFGILYSFISNKNEVEKLNRLLKQTENLVQDLEEEIEMKDSLIMKELTVEDHKSQIMDGGYFDDGVYDEHNNKDCVKKKAKDDCFSKIEAELEAELEMLELNMTSSTLERKISNLIELDPDFEPDLSEGELRADMLDNQADSNEDDRGTITTTHSANYSVSPKELSLRLHEILQSQLEERIRELESQIETKHTQNHKSWNHFLKDENRVDEPVVLNLSGEALDAYNEACNEFANLDESDEDDVAETPVYMMEDDDVACDDEDEMEKMLIKHIVEKARQGSPVVLNAHRALFSE